MKYSLKVLQFSFTLSKSRLFSFTRRSQVLLISRLLSHQQRMKPREVPVNRWKSGSQGYGRSWHAGLMAPPPRRKTGGEEDAFA
jgi:hypothetical protein